MKTNEKFSIHSIRVLKDNIVWIWTKEKDAIVIDPSISKPIYSWLKQNDLNLIAILQTHHHEDHIGGTKGLKDFWPKARVIASRMDINRIPFQDISVSDNEELFLMGSKITIFDVSGHTKGHIAFFINPTKVNNPILFIGDTIFSAGCGRIFECSAEEMFSSIQKIKELPINTEIYCAHEYTKSNLNWALSIEPWNKKIQRKLQHTEKLLNQGKLSIPTTLKEELEINLFLKASSIEEFRKLRTHKDKW
tara:strand:+ start:5666 stop:6412 length:747 start_codon:yes stop_codon:yes gene_type:complete